MEEGREGRKRDGGRWEGERGERSTRAQEVPFTPCEAQLAGNYHYISPPIRTPLYRPIDQYSTTLVFIYTSPRLPGYSARRLMSDPSCSVVSKQAKYSGDMFAHASGRLPT